jgi:uncharacterized protein (TIGR03437 family)
MPARAALYGSRRGSTERLSSHPWPRGNWSAYSDNGWHRASARRPAFASPGQINAALPLDALGPATVPVTTSAGFAETEIGIAGVAPAIFPSAITHADGTLVPATALVTPGKTLVIYMTGRGQVDGKIGAGWGAMLRIMIK